MVTDKPLAAGELQLANLTAENLPAAVKVIEAAFATDPVTRFIHEANEYDPTIYATSKETFHRWACLSALALGHPSIVKATSSSTDGKDDDVRAVALWFPPGTGPTISSIPYLDAVRLFYATGLRVVKRVYWDLEPPLAAAKARVMKKHDVEKYWYLFILGSDPAFQGTGLGSRLVKAGTDRADAEGLHVYLESSNPDNVPFYKKHGFLEEETIVLAGRVPMVMMIRPPRKN